MKKNKKIEKNKIKSHDSKFYIIISDTLNCLTKGYKCKYKISYFLLPFMPIVFLILGYLAFVLQIFHMLKNLFRK